MGCPANRGRARVTASLPEGHVAARERHTVRNRPGRGSPSAHLLRTCPPLSKVVSQGLVWFADTGPPRTNSGHESASLLSPLERQVLQPSTLVCRSGDRVGGVRAVELAEQVPMVRRGTTGAEAARVIAEYRLSGLVVADDDGVPIAVVPGSQVLSLVLPQYVRDEPNLSHAYDERGRRRAVPGPERGDHRGAARGQAADGSQAAVGAAGGHVDRDRRARWTPGTRR